MSSSVNNENIVQLSPDKLKYTSIAQAIEELRNGKPVVLAEDEGRENEGVLIASAEKATAQMMNLMMHARGVIRVAMLPERAQQLRLTQNDENETPYMISIDAGSEFGVTNGLSANDKAITVQRLAAPNATALDFRRPGHMFPVTAKKGGVFRYVDSAEAVIDLTRLAGHSPMGVICEILSEDGSMAQRDDLAAFARKHGLSFITISQLISYRLQNEPTISRRVVKEIDTRFGTFTAVGYKDTMDNGEHLALVKGSIENLANTVPYVRVQHENLISDMLGKSSDEMPAEMERALQFIQGQESGVVVYLRHSGDSRGLLSALQDYQKEKTATQNGYNNDQNNLREYGTEAQILADLGIKQMRRLSNNERKIIALRGYGVEVVETISLDNGSTVAPAPVAPPKLQLPSAATQNDAPDIMANMPSVIVDEDFGEFVSPANAPSVTLTEAPVVQTTTTEAPKAQEENTQERPENHPELTAEPRKSSSLGSMKMGGQVMKGQALFEG